MEASLHSATPSVPLLQGRPWTRIALLVLGASAVVMLYATHRIGERHVDHYAPLERSAADLRLSLSYAHLWLEEYLTGDPRVDVDADVFGELDRAGELARALIGGGPTDSGEAIDQPLYEPELRAHARTIASDLHAFRLLARSRLRSDSGIGSRLDERFDEVFRGLLAEVGELQRGIEARTLAGRRRSNLLFGAILAAWILLLGLTLATLQRRERRQRETELALRHSEDQLRQGQKLEAVGRLAGGLAHDVNNYLATINSQAGLVKILHGDTAGITPLMDEIIGTSGRTTALIDRLLAFSRNQPARPRPIRLDVLAGELTSMLRRLLGDDVRLAIRSDPDLWPVEADPSQIEQVLVNLLVNASEAMPGGGPVTVTLANVTVPASAGRHAGDHICLAVSDAGAGIAPEIRDKIFDPFFSTKERVAEEAGGHSGLGLTTVFGVVRQAGGFVEVDSEVGRGTTFLVYLPRTRRTPEVPARQAAQSEAPCPAAGESSYRILVVEDDRSLRRVTTAVLAAVGHRVTAAGDGEEGMRLLGEADPPFDAVVTDLVMPRASGRDVAEVALANPHTGVVLTSGFRGRIPVDELLLCDRVRYLDKPFTPRGLLAAIEEVVEERPGRTGAARGAQPSARSATATCSSSPSASSPRPAGSR